MGKAKGKRRWGIDSEYSGVDPGRFDFQSANMGRDSDKSDL